MILDPVFAWWLLGDRISRLGAPGIGVALGGVILIVRLSPSTFTDASAVGQLLVLGAAAAVAFGSVLVRRVRRPVERVPLIAWARAAGVLLLHRTSLAVAEAPTRTIGLAHITVVSPLVVAGFSLVERDTIRDQIDRLRHWGYDAGAPISAYSDD